MKPEQVDYLIAEFEKRASAALDEDDMKKWHELADLHKSLLDWKEQLKNGLDEPCPVDYAKYGIELPENIPSRRKEAGQQVAPVSTTAAGTRPIGGEKPTAIEKKGSPPRKPLSRKATGRSEGIAPAEVNATKEKASRPGIIEESVRQPKEAAASKKQRQAKAKTKPAEAGDESGFQNQIERADTYLQKEEFRQVITLLQTILDRPGITPELARRASSMLRQARSKREARIKELAKQGRQAMDRSDWGSAEAHYTEISNLDEQDERAKNGMIIVQNARSDAEDRTRLEEVKIQLRDYNRSMVDELDSAVRNAEGFIARKRADDELIRLLEPARKHWDELRDRQGQTTTKARLGNLEQAAEAVHEYQQYIMNGHKRVWDATVDDYIPTVRALEEARTNWERLSKRETEVELNLVQRNIPHNLDWARDRLQSKDVNRQYYAREDKEKKDPLGYAFQETDRDRLQEELAKVEQQIAVRDQTETLIEQARSADPEKALNLLLEAQSQWPHLAGLEKRIGNQREQVARLLAGQATAKLEEARGLLDSEKFPEARSLAGEAESLCKRLPGETPEVLSAVESQINEFLTELRKRQGIATEFSGHEKEIQRLLRATETRATALKLFDKLGRDDRFKELPQFKRLRVQIDAFRDVSKTWEEIERQTNASVPDWEDLVRRCNALIEADKGGEFTKKASRQRALANQEINLREARRYLQNGDIDQAERIFNDVLRENEDRQPELQKDLEKIASYRKNDEKVRVRMSRADSLRTSRDFRQKLEALQLYREIAEDADRSSFSMKAQLQADQMGASLHDELVPKLEVLRPKLLVYEARRIQGAPAGPQKAEGLLTDMELEQAASWAEVLRLGNLTWSGDDKRLVRDFEVAYSRRQADIHAEGGNWNRTVEILEDLESIWPVAEVSLEVRKARKQRAILEAQTLLTQEQAKRALETLSAEQTKDGWGGDGELNYYLGEAYRYLEQFEDAMRCARVAAEDTNPTIRQRGQALLGAIAGDRQVVEARSEIERFHQVNDYEAALETFRALPPDLQSHPNLSRLKEKIIREAQSELSKSAAADLGKGTVEGTVMAVETLARLKGLEGLAEVRESKAEGELKKLRDQLPMAARQIIKSTGSFQPSAMSLGDALQEARRLSNQIRAFSSIEADFPADTWPELRDQIQQWRLRLSDRIERMERIQGRLEKTRVDSDMWKMAVRTGNFKVLQEIAASVQECAGPDLQVLDVKEFLSRFREAKELRDYLHEQFGKIKEDRENLFLMQEDFPAVIRLCNEMRNLPARRTLPSTGGDSWLAVSQEDYRQILHLADNELDFYDPFAEKQLAELSAEHKRSLLDELSALAVQRSADLQKWEKWQTKGEQLYEDAKNLYSSASRPQGSIQDSLHKWNSVRESCKAAAAYLTMHPAPVSSYRAQEILEGAQTLVDDVEKWVANVEKTIGEHGELTSNIPAPEELIRLSRGSDYSRFAEALVRARFNGREKNVKEFTEHLGQNVLRKMKSPSLEELRRLYDFSERCLGTEDRITRVIAEAVAEKENPPKRGLWPFGRK